MIICAISDTHNKHKKITIPECDILIHSGDATSFGRKHEIRSFAEWFEKQPAKHKIFVPGNHELEFEKAILADPNNRGWFTAYAPSVKLLIEQSITIDNLKIYGSPITPYFYNWAWNRFPEGLIEAWAKIPDDTNILITHGPAYTILDTINSKGESDNLGCIHLLHRIKKLENLKLHIFGHIHGCGGQIVQHIDLPFTSWNAAVCDEDYNSNNIIKTINVD